MQDAFAVAVEQWRRRHDSDESAHVADQHGALSRDRSARRDARADAAQRARARRRRRRRRSRRALDDESGVEDDRLRLIFTCCHPALAREAQVALTLRTICGLTTEEIARAFLVPVRDDGAATRARDEQDSRRAAFRIASRRRASSPSDSIRCSRWSTSCSPRAMRRRAATRSCAASSAAKRSASRDCSSS